MAITAADMTQAFLRHRKVTQQLCDLMPDDKFSFAPWDGALTFGQLAVHVAGSADFYTSMAEGKPFERPDPASLPRTPAAIRAYLAERTEEQTARIARLGDLERTVSFRDRQVPVAILLGWQREHEAHHKGQMMTIARMCGVRDEIRYTA